MSSFPQTPYDAHCSAIIRELSTPVAPEPTGIRASIVRLEGVRAVLFDVYGTLFVSGSGDIGAAAEKGNTSALQDALSALGIDLDADAAEQALDDFHELIRNEHARSRQGGNDYPEVNIASIWQALLGRLVERGLSSGGLSDARLHELAVHYECRQNPVWPMPGLSNMLARLAGHDVLLGIVSNSQFFTPLLFQSLIASDLEALGFDPSLCAWSWISREAKPSPKLLAPVLDALDQRGVSPREVVLIGNDMLNDIRMAAEAGCQTVLYAGDTRSLRMREDHPDCADLFADAVITQLDELISCLGLQD